MITKSNIILSYSLHALAHSPFKEKLCPTSRLHTRWNVRSLLPRVDSAPTEGRTCQSSHFTEHSGCNSTELCREFIIYYLQVFKALLMKPRSYLQFQRSCLKEIIWSIFSPFIKSGCIKHGSKTSRMKKTKQILWSPYNGLDSASWWILWTNQIWERKVKWRAAISPPLCSFFQLGQSP